MKGFLTKIIFVVSSALVGVLTPRLAICDEPARDKDEIIPLIQVEDVAFSDVIRNLALQTAFNFSNHPKLQPKIVSRSLSFRMENLSAEEALKRLLHQYDLHAVRSPASSVTRIMSAKLVSHVAPKDWIAGDTNT